MVSGSEVFLFDTGMWQNSLHTLSTSPLFGMVAIGVLHLS